MVDAAKNAHEWLGKKVPEWNVRYFAKKLARAGTVKQVCARGDASGSLSAADEPNSPKLALLGNYMAASFVTAADGHGGTFIMEGSQTANELVSNRIQIRPLFACKSDPF
jgi:hypothetical protein